MGLFDKIKLVWTGPRVEYILQTAVDWKEIRNSSPYIENNERRAALNSIAKVTLKLLSMPGTKEKLSKLKGHAHTETSRGETIDLFTYLCIGLKGFKAGKKPTNKDYASISSLCLRLFNPNFFNIDVRRTGPGKVFIKKTGKILHKVSDLEMRLKKHIEEIKKATNERFELLREFNNLNDDDFNNLEKSLVITHRAMAVSYLLLHLIPLEFMIARDSGLSLENTHLKTIIKVLEYLEPEETGEGELDKIDAVLCVVFLLTISSFKEKGLIRLRHELFNNLFDLFKEKYETEEEKEMVQLRILTLGKYAELCGMKDIKEKATELLPP